MLVYGPQSRGKSVERKHGAGDSQNRMYLG